MTRQEFKSEFGAEWVKFTNKPIFRALIDTMQEESPMVASSEQIPGNIVVGGAVLYAECSGYQKGIKFLKTIGTQQKEKKALVADYKEPSV